MTNVNKKLAVMMIFVIATSGCATIKSRSHRTNTVSATSRSKRTYLNQPNIKRLIIGKARKGRDALKRSRNKEKFAQWKKSYRMPLSSHVPLLTEPKITTVWVEDQIIGKKYVEGHFEHLLKEPAKWKE